MAEFETDVVVVGGGMAGVSVAAELAARVRVVLLEAEPTLAYHTTGRSAATSLETYGNQPVRALTAASRPFLSAPPDGFAAPLVSPRPLLYIATAADAGRIEQLHAEVRDITPTARLLTGAQAEAGNPLLRKGYVAAALSEPGALDVDVHALHQGYVGQLRERGATIVRAARLASGDYRGGQWELRDKAGRSYRARIVIDAAGAWADQVGGLLGARALGLEPRLRSVFVVDAPPDIDVRGLPLIDDIAERFYLKPDGATLLCSPADETPVPPGDARPDELAIARAIETVNEATVLDVRHVRRSWGGLRTFAPDRTPVVGFDPVVPGLFWFAGQGGYGIQLAPALARVGAALALGRPLPEDVLARGLAPAALDPRRFRTG